LDGPGAGDDKGKPRGEAKAARKLAKKLRQGTPVETDWNLYHELTTLPPKQLAALPIWDHADKLGRSEFLLLAERQQGARAALATGLPVSAAGQPGSLDAQLHAVARTKGWDSAAHAEARGLIEREIRAEIAANFDSVYETYDERLVLAKRNGDNKVIFVELKPSSTGKYWNVISSGLRNDMWLKKRSKIWPRTEPNK
jgi:hypothetical protein